MSRPVKLGKMIFQWHTIALPATNAATPPVKAHRTLIIAYVVVFLAALCGVALYYEQRQKRSGRSAQRDHIFRCEKCGFRLIPTTRMWIVPAARHAAR